MNSIKFLSIATFYLILVSASSQAAPATDSPAGQESSPTTLATSSDSSSTPSPTTVAPATTLATSSEQPSTEKPKEADAAAPVTHEQLSKSSFTCYGRTIGYYADIERDCKVYHFCLLGDYNGEAVYQRITYLCLKDTVFDQQVLDCVEPSKMAGSCKDSETHYVTSNASLRKEIVEHKLHGD